MWFIVENQKKLYRKKKTIILETSETSIKNSPIRVETSETSIKDSPIMVETIETSMFYGWNPYKCCLNPLVINQLGAPDRIAQAQREAQPAKNTHHGRRLFCIAV